MEITVGSFGRVGYGIVALTGLGLVYLFQYTDFLYLFSGAEFAPEYHFMVNRLVRIFANDCFMLVLIYAIFMEPKVVRLGFYVQLIDLLVLFPLYLSIKLPTEGISELSSPFLSQFHRLIVNPTLMVLTIGGIFYQKLGTKHVV